MKKTIITSLFAAFLSLNALHAHCGSCGTGDDHEEKAKACPATCEKSSCDKSKEKAEDCATKCDKSKCDKDEPVDA